MCVEHPYSSDKIQGMHTENEGRASNFGHPYCSDKIQGMHTRNDGRAGVY